MTVLHISQAQQLITIAEQHEPFTCLLRDDCHCDASHFQNSQCMGLAIVGRRAACMRRGKQLVERELSRKYACPVRLFKDVDHAERWLLKQMQVAVN